MSQFPSHALLPGRALIRLAMRRLADRPGRLAMTLVAIAASVAFASAALIVSDSLTDTFSSIAVNANRDVDLQVRSLEDDLGVSVPIDAGIVERLDGIDGIDAVNAAVEAEDSTVLALDATGQPVVPVGPPVKSFSWNGVSTESLWLVDGAAPVGSNDVVMNVDYAEMVGVDVGDRVDFVTASGPDAFTLVGLVDLDVTAGAQFVLFDLATAQSVYGRGDTVDVIDLTLDGKATTQEITESIMGLVSSDLEVVGHEQVVQEFRAPFDTVITVVRSALLGFAGIAIIVCLILIANTFAVMVNQQTAELGALRAIGASRTQIAGSIAVEAVMVGAIGSVLGLAGGVGLSELMKLAFGAVGGFPATDTIVSGQTVVIAFVVGIGATLGGAISPAFAAGRISPISAMRESAASRGSRGITGWLFTALASSSTDLAAPRSVARRLAFSHAAADPKRTRATAAALTIGMAMIVVVGTIGQALRSEAADAADRSLAADAIVSASSSTALASYAAEDLPPFGQLFEVPTRLQSGETLTMTALDSAALRSGVSITGLSSDAHSSDGSSIDSLSKGGVGVDVDWATDHGVALGDVLTVDLGAGTVSFPIVTTFERSGALVEPVIVHITTIEPLTLSPKLVGLTFGGGSASDTAALLATLEEVAARYPGIEVQDQAAFAAASDAQIDQIELIANGLLGITVLIALIGVANTMALAISQRRHEITMLRAIGMTRRQVRRGIRLEALVVSGYGIAVGAVLGLVLAGAASGVLDAVSPTDLRPPMLAIGVAALTAMVGSMLAAAVPARRAARS